MKPLYIALCNVCNALNIPCNASYNVLYDLMNNCNLIYNACVAESILHNASYCNV